MFLIDPRFWLGLIAAFALGLGTGEIHARYQHRIQERAMQQAANLLVAAKNDEIAKLKQEREIDEKRIRAEFEVDLAAYRRANAALRLRLEQSGSSALPTPADGPRRSARVDSDTGRICITDPGGFIALMDEVAASLAAGRACQAFLHSNHLLRS